MTNYTLLPPQYTLHGVTCTLPQQDGAFADANFRVTQTETTLCEGLVRLTRTFYNLSPAPVEFQCALFVRTAFRPNHYVIPCVSYNGNHFGADREPKDLTCEGKPWVFSYERTGIPSCTVSENAETFFALFASDASAASLVSSCTLLKNSDGTMTHGIHYPNVERPKSYTRKNAYTEAYEPTLSLAAGESISFDAYLLTGKPAFRNFAVAQAEDAAMRLLHPALPPVRDYEPLRRASLSFIDTLTSVREDGKLLAIGAGFNEEGKVVHYPRYEIGWCGQNALFARLLMEECARTGDRHLLATATEILDTWMHAFRENGLMYVYYEEIGKAHAIADTCNLGYAGAELLRCYRAARALGVERPLWREKALGIADFMLVHESPVYGFGKAWEVESGNLIDERGTVGAFIIPALLEAYAETGKGAYLAAARRSYAFYLDRDLDHFVCTAGALDSDCVDKETSFAMLVAGLMLYETTKETPYLDAAKKAAYYFCSFLYHYDVRYPADCEFTRYNWHTAGGTSVSVTHHHMDPWGAFCVESFLRLGEITGDPLWQARADLMFANAVQCVAVDDTLIIHGKVRPLGSQNEAYFQCRWYWDTEKEPIPGMMNDWLVAWPCAFRLHAIHAYDKRKA